jgi:Xaa-Pro aminopeptidase
MLEYAAIIVPANGEAVLLVGPECYDLACQESRLKDIRICQEMQIPGEEYPNTRMYSLKDILEKFGKVRKIGTVNLQYAPNFVVSEITKSLNHCEFIDSSMIIKRMRAIKSPAEQEIIRHAYEVTARAINAGQQIARPGMSEPAIASYMAQICYTEGGASQLSHCFMAAAGRKSAAALSFPSDKNIVAEGDTVILDIGFVYEGYFSDAAKTFICGESACQEKKDALAVATEALHAAINTVKAGVPGREVDFAARTIIEKAGFGKHCLYGVMHGVGLQHCEYPMCGPDTDMKLEENMIFSIDIGLFNFAWGGIRQEAGILVRNGGVEVLGCLH